MSSLFSFGSNIAVVCWSVDHTLVNMGVASELLCRYGQADVFDFDQLTQVCAAKRNVCSAEKKSHLQSPSRQLCEILPQRGHYLMRVVRGQWRLRRLAFCMQQVENRLTLWCRAIW